MKTGRKKKLAKATFLMSLVIIGLAWLLLKITRGVILQEFWYLLAPTYFIVSGAFGIIFGYFFLPGPNWSLSTVIEGKPAKGIDLFLLLTGLVTSYVL